MAKSGAQSCAFITASNPGSKRLSEARNQGRWNNLVKEILKRGYAFLEGKGMARDPGWMPEASMLILGIDRRNAVELGRCFEQIAIVFAERGQAVELVLCEQ